MGERRTSLPGVDRKPPPWTSYPLYSAILDVAGHLQKQAEVDGCLISEATLRELPGDLPFEPAGELEREGLGFFRLAGAVE